MCIRDRITHYQLPNTNLPALHALLSLPSFLPPFFPPSFLASSLPSYLPSCLHTPIPFFCFSQPSLPPSYILKEQQLNNVRWFNNIRYSKGRASRRALSLSPRAFAQPGYSYKKNALRGLIWEACNSKNIVYIHMRNVQCFAIHMITSLHKQMLANRQRNECELGQDRWRLYKKMRCAALIQNKQ